MQLQRERRHESSFIPGFRYEIRRISLAERLNFLAVNHELLKKLKFQGAAPELTDAQRVELGEMELEMSRRLLELCLVSTGEGAATMAASAERIAWLLHEAPAGLCVEVLARISDEISLSEQRRKN